MTKYHARKVTADGYTFDSQAECRAYQMFRLMEAAGEIAFLEVHPKLVLMPEVIYHGKKLRAVTYIADFKFLQNEQVVIVDVKGFRTAAFLLKWRIAKSVYPSIDFRIVEAKDV